MFPQISIFHNFYYRQFNSERNNLNQSLIHFKQQGMPSDTQIQKEKANKKQDSIAGYEYIQDTPPSKQIKQYMRKKQIAFRQQFNTRSIFNQLSTQSKTQFMFTATMSKHQATQYINTQTAKIKKNKQFLYQDLCPICLSSYVQPKAKLQCSHEFCNSCLQQWIKTATVCPCCRYKFQTIMVNGKQIVEVQSKQMKFNEQDYLVCYVCGRGDNQHVLLVCDQCDYYCCHIYCDRELSLNVPEGDWFCRNCTSTIIARQQQNQQKKQERTNDYNLRLRNRLVPREQPNLNLLRRLRRRN